MVRLRSAEVLGPKYSANSCSRTSIVRVDRGRRSNEEVDEWEKKNKTRKWMVAQRGRSELHLTRCTAVRVERRVLARDDAIEMGMAKECVCVDKEVREAKKDHGTELWGILLQVRAVFGGVLHRPIRFGLPMCLHSVPPQVVPPLPAHLGCCHGLSDGGGVHRWMFRWLDGSVLLVLVRHSYPVLRTTMPSSSWPLRLLQVPMSMNWCPTHNVPTPLPHL